MCDDMVGNHRSQSLSESYQPLLPGSVFHCTVILPIHINSIKIVLQNKLTQFLCASYWVNIGCGGQLSRSKSTNHYFDAIFIVLFFKFFLGLIFRCSKRIRISKIFHRVTPKKSNINRSVIKSPESQSNKIIHVVVRKLWHSNISSNFLRRPPIVDLVDIGKSNRIVDLFLPVLLMLMMMLMLVVLLVHLIDYDSIYLFAVI